MKLHFNLRPHQKEVIGHLKRINVLLAHRRFGKTVLSIVILVKKALECPLPRPQVHYYAPSYAQAKRVAWDYCKHATRDLPGTSYNESELKVTLPTGAIIQLGSGDNPDSSRGIYSDYLVLDEPAQMPPRLWSEVLRPALSDRKGGALFIGTPKGRHGLFYDMYGLAASEDDMWRGMYKSSETHIVDDDELQAASRSMSRAEFLQEYECSFDAAIKGAYYGEEMEKLETAGQIGHVLYDKRHPVYTSFDLGMNDATAIWFIQIIGNEYRLIDYQEFTNTGLPDIVRNLRTRDYDYGKWIFPFDVEVHSLSTGQTRLRTLLDLGVDAVVAPKLPIIDGIEEARAMMPRCFFDAVKCKEGIEALRQYRSDYDDLRGVLRLKPVHDWTSHAADAFRYLAVTPGSMIKGDWSSGKLDYSNLNRARA